MDLQPNGLLGLIHLAIAIYAIVKIVDSGASTGRKTLWILLVVVLPVLGIIAWYFMGPKR